MDEELKDKNIKILKCIIILIVIIPIFIIAIFYIWFYNEAIKIDLSENKRFFSIDTSNSEFKKRIMLADILNFKDEILITENNIDNTEKIIKEAELTSGIYITNESRDMVQQILDTVLGEKIYKINDRGYLIVLKKINETNEINIFLNEKINSNKLLIIDIDDTYKGILENGAILDVMLEQSVYAQNFVYNDNINICILNAQKLYEKNQGDISIKDIYEEILLDMISQK